MLLLCYQGGYCAYLVKQVQQCHLVQVKGAVVDKFTSEEELERRRLEAEAEEEAARKEAEAAERAKHRWGPFGLFRK